MRQLQEMTAAVFDFDKTVAETFRPSPNGLGTEEAYALAVSMVLGKHGEQVYRGQGLGNRAPTELVRDILKAGSMPDMLSCAQMYLEMNAAILDGLVPPGKGMPLVWSEEKQVEVIGELLTRAKLMVLVDELSHHPDGSIWPEPCSGVLEFMRELQKRGIATAILSSGHELFITRAFELWGAEAPLMLTDDDVRGLTSVSLNEKMKPHPFLFELLIRKWQDVQSWAHEPAHRRRFFYFGDDIVKDGRLAASAGLRFGLYDPESTVTAEMPTDQFRFADWRDLTKAMQAT